MLEVLEAGYAAGALPCCLSGAGSTLLALADGREEQIGAAMQSRWRDSFRTQARVQTRTWTSNASGTTSEPSSLPYAFPRLGKARRAQR